ncbi:hypothetical protein TEA_018958 [Camellia sinensis var. sinensis]|uniref:Uncharacterized protein n=1 Tax=Camellia sinensis var. sinensis TaxID=542762 RepID=A0A4S4EEY4_CAMSN|nr:hypothetical protein TEA_018958 [Camellia sinensis var. sinensis]
MQWDTWKALVIHGDGFCLDPELKLCKGHLSVVTEIYEVAHLLCMVELRKAGEDTLEFHKFYMNFATGLKDIVWKSGDETKEEANDVDWTHVEVMGTPDYVRQCYEASLKQLDVDYMPTTEEMRGVRKLQLYDEQLRDVKFDNKGAARLLNGIELGNKRSDRQSDKIVVKGIKFIGNVQLGQDAKDEAVVHHVSCKLITTNITMSRRSSRRFADVGNIPFMGSLQPKTHSSPLLSIGLVAVGAFLIIWYLYSGSGGVSCMLEAQKALPILKKAYGDSMRKVLHIGPETCTVVSELLKEEDTEAWGVEPYELDDADSNCKSLVHKGIVRVADIKFPLPYRSKSFSVVIVSDTLDYLSPRYLNKTLLELARV